MKNVSTIKSSNVDSPKTPGGISKSLLSPCPRIGLSRNYKRSGASPFQSPLSSKSEVKQEKVTRKRKGSLEELTPECDDSSPNLEKNVQTPSRKVELPRRKKSKTLLTSINKSSEENGLSQEKISATNNETDSAPCKSCDAENLHNESSKCTHKEIEVERTHNVNSIEVVTPSRLKSKSLARKNITPSNSILKPESDLENENLARNAIVETKPKENDENKEQSKEKSPNNLTKECIVVIQKKIFKKELKRKAKSPISEEKPKTPLPKTKETGSQPVFDSDSDDVPLICLNKEVDIKPTLNTIDDEEKDFASNKTKLSKPVKSKSKAKPKSPATKIINNTRIVEVDIHKTQDSQYSDDDDDFCEKKKTILIRKSYDKVIKPHKAKSTGSISQKDIDNLNARIETKKKMLLAKAMTEDTEELRELIKKWQKGCQDALMELMDLMKSKFPDKQNMDYSEILQSLKIPSSLVGYDSDNECFLTPNDESIILAKV